MFNAKEAMIIYKVRQLGFDTHIVHNIEKFFQHELNESEITETKALVTFIQEILVTS